MYFSSPLLHLIYNSNNVTKDEINKNIIFDLINNIERIERKFKVLIDISIEYPISDSIGTFEKQLKTNESCKYIVKSKLYIQDSMKEYFEKNNLENIEV